MTAIGWATTAGGVDVATNSLDGFPMAGAPRTRRRGRSRARRLFHGQLVLVAAHHDHGHHGPRHRHDDSDDGRRRHDVDGADLGGTWTDGTDGHDLGCRHDGGGPQRLEPERERAPG